MAGREFPVLISIKGALDASFQKAVGSAEKALGGLGKAGQSIEKVANKMLPLSASAGVVGGVMAKMAIGFNSALNTMGRTANLSEAEMESTRKAAILLAPKLGVLPDQYLAIASSMAQLGTKKSELPDMTRLVISLGQATEQPVEKWEEMGKAMSATASIFGLSIKQAEQYVASVNYVDDSIGSTASEIMDFTNRVGSLAATVKMSASDVAVFGGVMGKLGLPSERAATAFNSLLGTLAGIEKVSPKSRRAFVALGVDSQKVVSLMNSDPTKGIQYFMDTLNKSNLPLNQIVSNMQVAFGKESADEIMTLAKGAGTLAEGLKAVGNSQAMVNSLNSANKKALETTAGQLKVFKATVDSILISLGSALLPAINQMLGAVTPLLQKFLEFATVNPMVGKIAVALLSIVAIVPPLIVGFAALSSAIAAIGGGPAVLVIGGIVTALTTLVALAPQVWSGIQAIGKAFNDALSNESRAAIQGAINAIGQGLQWFASTIVPLAIGALGSLAGGIFSTAQSFAVGTARIVNAVTSLVGMIQGAVNQILVIWRSLPEGVKGIGEAMIATISQGILGGIPNLVGAAGSALSAVKKLLPQSDPEEGPLKNLSAMGAKIPGQLGLGISKGVGQLVTPMNTALASTPLPVVTGGGTVNNSGGSVVINAPVTINGGDGGIQQQVEQAFRNLLEQAQFMQRSSLA